MKNKNTQIYICALGESGAKHYVAVGTTKLHKEDLESRFTDTPTAAIMKALDGVKPMALIWVELEWLEEGAFSASTWYLSASGIRNQETCRMYGAAIRIGEFADHLVNDVRKRLRNINVRDTEEYREYGYQVVTCPVCGSETLDNYFICMYCQWEYDGVTEEDEYSDVNHATVRQHRENVRDRLRLLEQ